ncbi:ABC transporter permease [Verticiella sediminum]|uniref:ABC transporter permease n=1 Tax=Verticiella sediminum TaxID=1247510 RepID=A0A556AKH3_9BURK|nr:ABC transporter permease [Verticiella sediminum]TSH93397.1 ABC transporter permease [Verticiella sediminum]
MNTPTAVARPAEAARAMGAAATRTRAWRGVPTWLLLAPALVYLLATFGAPLANTFWTSLTEPEFGLQNYAHIFSNAFYFSVYLRTALVALAVTGLCLLLGYPLAYYMARRGGMAGAALLAVTGLCFWISFLVRTYAWTVILGNRGPYTAFAAWLGIDPAPTLLFTTSASLIAMTHILLPYMVLTLYVVLAKLDPNLIRAAHGLGASRLQVFWRVIAPLSLPGVVSGGLLVFIFCIGFYVTPTLLGSPQDMMIASLIANEVETLLDFGTASALSMVLLAAITLLLVAYDRLIGIQRITE